MVQRYYSLSFTTSSMRKHESLKLAELYLQYRNWKSVRDYVIENNILQQRTTRSSKKLCQELISRLRQLADEELIYLVKCPEIEKSIILWIAVCRRYRFISDFSMEVVREHLLTLKHHLDHADFEVFFSSKLNIYEELDSISISTKRKVRQVIFRMLQEVNLLDQNGRLNAIVPSSQMLALIDARELDIIGISALDFAISTAG